MKVPWGGRLTGAGIAAAAVIGAMTWPAVGSAHAETVCPALMVLGVPGTGESTPATTGDNGMLGTMFAPMLRLGAGTVDRQYVAYPAGFGGAVPGGTEPYAQSEQVALDRLGQLVAQQAAGCPRTTMFGLAGYSQGAQAVSSLARAIGAGHGPVSADRVAGVALISDPTRPPNGTVLPGLAGNTPLPAPGTVGRAVSAIRLPGVPGGAAGIGADPDGFGALTGRVAEFCAEGDLACAAPDHAALLSAAAGVAAQADLRDPFAAAESLSRVWSQVQARAWLTVMSQDVASGPVPYYQPKRTLSQRLADAADPMLPAPSPQETARAQINSGRVAAAVAADPLGELGGLLGQFAAAMGGEVDANRDLLDPSVWLRYADLGGRHRSYAAAQGGPSSTEAAAQWFAALGRDIADRA